MFKLWVVVVVLLKLFSWFSVTLLLYLYDHNLTDLKLNMNLNLTLTTCRKVYKWARMVFDRVKMVEMVEIVLTSVWHTAKKYEDARMHLKSRMSSQNEV